MNPKGKVIWLTGMSGAGKSFIAREGSVALERLGHSIAQIDGDDVRKNYCCALGFSYSDIWINNKTVIKLADHARKEVDFVLITVIGPLKAGRELARQKFSPNYAEVYVSASLDSLRNRDTKGLYLMAERGEIDDLIGVGNGVAYESPLNPELWIDTDVLDTGDAVQTFVEFARKFGKKSY